MLLIGDSHSASLYPSLHSYLNNQMVSLDMLSAAFCLPVVTEFPKKVTQATNDRCANINRQVREVITNGGYDLIVVSAYMYEWGFRNNPNWTYEGYYADFLREMKTLSLRNKIMVVGQFPVWKMPLPDILAQELSKSGFDRIEDAPVRSQNEINEDVFPFENRYKKDISQLGIEYVSIIQASCIDKSCLRYISTANKPQLVSFDYGHLSLAGSQFFSANVVGPAIIESLKH